MIHLGFAYMNKLGNWSMIMCQMVVIATEHMQQEPARITGQP